MDMGTCVAKVVSIFVDCRLQSSYFVTAFLCLSIKHQLNDSLAFISHKNSHFAIPVGARSQQTFAGEGGTESCLCSKLDNHACCTSLAERRVTEPG
jgi:hypothetical protein